MSGQQPTGRSAAGSRTLTHWYDPEREPLDIVDGDGSYVTTADGEEYLDFIAQLYCVNAGHGNRAIVEAIEAQLEKVQYVSAAKHNDARSELAERLVEVTPDSLTDVCFSVSGSEANELAAGFAREHTGGNKVLTRWRSYHGSTAGAGSFTGDPETRAPLERHAATTGAGKFLPPLPRAFGGVEDPQELADRAIEHLRFVIHNEGPDSIAAVLMEPVGGTSGAYPAPADYFQQLRDLCDEYGILLIADEVITGFGRCGDWFGVQGEGVDPDLLTFAKGVTSAYVPLAGVAVSADIAEEFREEGFPLGQTFSGHPVACAAGVAALDQYGEGGGLIENVREHAGHFESRVRELEAHDVVHDVHGRGYLWGVEFADPDTGEPFADPRVSDDHNPVDDVLAAASDGGVLLGSGRPNVQVICSPPLVAGPEEIDRGVDALDAAIEAVF
ncbi:aminotransferase family protein [Halomarina litorea]|uniref:aminotransferase family protein n=1 Tax=Halomarina litorea TaxID=2961595 RepID=UPI0020C2BD4B|nr:aspartate aminotransferase family protein [Halomarina sp. BCD28]